MNEMFIFLSIIVGIGGLISFVALVSRHTEHTLAYNTLGIFISMIAQMFIFVKGLYPPEIGTIEIIFTACLFIYAFVLAIMVNKRYM